MAGINGAEGAVPRLHLAPYTKKKTSFTFLAKFDFCFGNNDDVSLFWKHSLLAAGFGGDLNISPFTLVSATGYDTVDWS